MLADHLKTSFSTAIATSFLSWGLLQFRQVLLIFDACISQLKPAWLLGCECHQHSDRPCELNQECLMLCSSSARLAGDIEGQHAVPAGWLCLSFPAKEADWLNWIMCRGMPRQARCNMPQRQYDGLATGS